jgi:long-chain acyl-CoA synthetase
MEGATSAEIIKNADFKKAVLDALDQLGRANKLSGLERPKDLYLTADPFSVENNILTPTFKLKRNVGRDVYKPQIDELYADLAKRGF